MPRRYCVTRPLVCILLLLTAGCAYAQFAAELPRGVSAVWDLGKAHHETTPTRELVCINGLWRWQPADAAAEAVPADGWGYFKVPGPWPGINNWLQKDCQTVYAHPRWREQNLGALTAAWYEREFTVPPAWAGRRISLDMAYLNSYARVYVDGAQVGELRFPAGELDLTTACEPGATHRLSMVVLAMPLKGVMLSFNDTASAREVQGSVARRGLCGDVYLVSGPATACVTDVKVDTSVGRGEITINAAVADLTPGARYTLKAVITDAGQPVHEFTSAPFSPADLTDGRLAFTEQWKPEKLWDTITPENMCHVAVSLQDAGGAVLDTSLPVRFGFREFYVDGRDFYLNGTRIFLSAVPLDNAQISAGLSTYDAARESLLRLQSFGINFVYTHNYGCEPGSHIGFAEVLRAADDVGMLVALSQPHFGHYEWTAEDAEQTNGYAAHAEFYVRVAQNHPSVVAYAMSHNATGYAEDMNPDMIDGKDVSRDQWSSRNVQRALVAEGIVNRLDPTRVIYHHSSGNLSSMHTVNFYPNFAPVQELSDWFEHWSTEGVKPVFLCEYGAPFSWDFAMYRGWYKGSRAFGSAVVPWELCLAEWNSQFCGDSAYDITEVEKTCLRWEAEQFEAGRLWHRWDYPSEMGSRDFEEQYPVMGLYTAENWRAFRTWELSANSPWIHAIFWKPREGVRRGRRDLTVDWEDLQRPGFSPDYIDREYERMDLSFERSDWTPFAPAEALYRNNMPLLGYIAGKPDSFTSKDHIFYPGEAFDKQLIIINNSRRTVSCDCSWSFALPTPITGARQASIPTGEQQRVPLRLDLPADLAPGTYELTAGMSFSTGETQTDAFAITVIPRAANPEVATKIALFDPQGETAALLRSVGVACDAVDADADLSAYDLLVIGKQALTVDGPAPDLSRVPEGLRVIVFEQEIDALEKRLGFRVVAYGLRNVFPRVPDHPLIAGLDLEQLRDWRGEATLLPPRLEYERGTGSPPTIQWCGINVTRLWRAGCRGNVASVLIEKPTRGDFLPILDGGFSLQYSPLLEYRQGSGMVLFCQMDITGRTEAEPVAETLARRIIAYAADWQPAPRRTVLYVGDAAGRRHLEFAGIDPASYTGGALSSDQVLVVGPGGGEQLAGHAAAIADFLAAGGNLLALGLDQAQANAFLPFDVQMTQQEHIATLFGAPGNASLLAGVAPADVHNRDPREIPLVTGGASILGDGVLATGEGSNVVFCQLPPHTITKAEGAVPSLVVNADDAVEGKQSALVTMGCVTGRGGQLLQKVSQPPTVGKTYTMTVMVKALREPVQLRLEIERAGRPWDRAYRGEMVTIPVGEWTPLHATFTVDKPFPEGWQAYVACFDDGGLFRADVLQLYEGTYVPWQQAATSRENLFANPSFEAGVAPWSFSPDVNRNRRRTYRRASFMLSRILANMGVGATPPLLEHFATPPGGGADAETVLRNGDLGADADANGTPDDWAVSLYAGTADTAREQLPDGAGWAQRMTIAALRDDGKGSAMLAQHDVPATAGQWYRISFRARAEGLEGVRVPVALVSTEDWQAIVEYQRFVPAAQWQDFSFLVQAKRTAEAKTRFQIWFDRVGSVWLSDIRMAPVNAPDQGRWLAGLYLDQPEEWDDPYRFFRW